MATFSLTVTKVRKIGGRVYVEWSDGTQQEFSSLADAVAVRDTLAENKDILKAMAIARYLRLDPTAVTPTLIEGKTISFSDSLNSMVTVV